MKQPDQVFDLSVFRTFFHRAFGKVPYRFQTAIVAELLGGNNVVALAPTGAGKTLAPIAAFMYARNLGLDFADRLVYALPQRTLTIALRNSVQDAVRTSHPDLRVTIQTGNMPEDPYFEGDVIFTTIDQVLSAHIEVPVSLSDRLANIPAGALLGSLIVFDEFHLLEPTRALATALDLAKQLKPYSRTLLMSATFPRSALDEVVNRAKASLVEVQPEEIAAIPSQRDKRRTFVWHPEPMTAKAVLDTHQELIDGMPDGRHRTIVVVNRVVRAQDLYEEIKVEARARKMDVRVLLLHSRFRQVDRQAREQEVIEYFEKNGPGRAILVATPVVEVGLDITCNVLHTEVATASALFQRAGRCARYEREEGVVHVYELESTERGRRYGPYNPDRAVVDAVATEIAARSGDMIRFATEKEVVDLTHKEMELRNLNSASIATRREQVVGAQRDHAPSRVRELVRQVDSVNILIHENPSNLDLAMQPDTFSLPRSVLYQFLGRADLANQPRGLVLWPEFPEDAEGYRKAPDWRPLLRAEDAEGHFVLAVHPSLASYDRDCGLRLLPPVPGNYESQPTLTVADTRIERYSYQMESYSEHASRVLKAAADLLPAHRVATSRVAQTLGLSSENLGHLVRLVAALHDTGKLSTGVQATMWRWMEEVHQVHRTGFLAHTTFDARDSRQVALDRQARFRKPPHAVEGAYAANQLLSDAVQRLGVLAGTAADVVRALFSAIARHHSPAARTLRTFELSAGAQREVTDHLQSFGVKGELADKPSDVHLAKVPTLLADPGTNEVGYTLYLFVVRLLRMADQRATARKE